MYMRGPNPSGPLLTKRIHKAIFKIHVDLYTILHLAWATKLEFYRYLSHRTHSDTIHSLNYNVGLRIIKLLLEQWKWKLQ